jgi:dephospho-CoA kinase
MRRLALSGKMASGKDTIARAALNELGLDHVRINLADAIRHELQHCYDLADTDPELVRAHLSPWAANDHEHEIVDQLVSIARSNRDAWERTSATRLGLQQLAWLGRQHQPDLWIARHRHQIDTWTAGTSPDESGLPVLLTTDVREADEVHALHQAGYLLVRLLVDPAVQRRRLRQRDQLTADHSVTHPNETALDELDGPLAACFAAVIDNNHRQADTVAQLVALLRDRWQL